MVNKREKRKTTHAGGLSRAAQAISHIPSNIRCPSPVPLHRSWSISREQPPPPSHVLMNTAEFRATSWRTLVWPTRQRLLIIASLLRIEFPVRWSAAACGE